MLEGKSRGNLEKKIKKRTMKGHSRWRKGEEEEDKTEKRQSQNEARGVCRIREDTKLTMLKSAKCFARLGIWQVVL